MTTTPKNSAETSEPILHEVSDTTNGTSVKNATNTQSIRVNLSILDELMNLVGELVLSRNQLIELAKNNSDTTYISSIQHLNRVTSRLQESIMKTRMQPVGNAWTKLPRIVRDLQQSNGKSVDLRMLGQDTEIDRQILQAISDPLVHCVRNSVDHGIESPEVRSQAGKAPTGTITLNAYQQGGYIVIEVSDDGAGMNVNKIKSKAIERGLCTAEQAATMPDNQVFRFVFEPGFSTANRITEVSGRGVGMDVVRSNIEKIGGAVDINSRLGHGTSIQIKIPLTLAIISALIVNVGGEDGQDFAIPQVSVLELVRISAEQSQHIEEIHGARFLRLRDQILPLLDLGDLLGMSRPQQETEASDHEYFVVVAQIDNSQFGIVVNKIHDTQEVVVKPSGRITNALNLYSGTTILGDGRVIIILDIAKLGEKIFKEGAQLSSITANNEVSRSDVESTNLLLMRSGHGAPLAVPLSLVARLEEFKLEKIEFVNKRHVIQYRDSLLPLIAVRGDVTQHVDQATQNGRDSVWAVIFSDGKRHMGLIVSDIDDIVEHVLDFDYSGSAEGILGSIVIGARATEMIDANHYLKIAHPSWFADQEKLRDTDKNRILLVEDSRFFVALIKPILESSGYSVTLAQDGKEAISALEKSHGKFDLILSDIEMPEMDGLALARYVQKHEEWQKIPMVAMTSLVDENAKQKGLEAGFRYYLPKFDRDNMLMALVKAINEAQQKRSFVEPNALAPNRGAA